jgi:hypothetical protein
MSDNPEDFKYMIEPHEALVFDPQEFLNTFNFAMHAMIRKNDANKPSKWGFTSEEEDGSLVRYQFSDTPMNRATMTVRDIYEGDQFISYMHRLKALLDIVEDEGIAKWRKRVEGGYDIDDAVVMAAAIVPLTEEGDFPRDRFFQEIERIVKETAAK